jgi:hypothetical protein
MGDHREFPRYYYKAGEPGPQYAGNKKDEDRLRQEGWTEGYNSIPPLEYPKMLYGPKGENRKVQSLQEERDWILKGYAASYPEPASSSSADDEPPYVPAPRRTLTAQAEENVRNRK